MSDFSATIAGLDALVERVNDATGRIVLGAAEIFRVHAMENAPVGDPENSTNPPGDMAANMAVEGPIGGDGEWTARVGSVVETVNPGRGGAVFNYSRQREFGGEITPNASIYMTFKRFGIWSKRTSVFQEGSHFLGRARDETGEIESLMETELTAAVRGY